MANITLGMANFADEATLTGGSWVGTLPLNNLKTRLFSRVARSADTLAASTKFDIALSRPRTCRVLALAAHNFSVAATIRVVADDSPTFATPLYDSGAVAMWPAGVIPIELLEWDDDNFWLGTVSEEAIAGYQAPFICLLPAAVTARYWRVEIVDTGNSAGYIQLGRLYIANTWSPKFNMDYGHSLGFDDVSTFETSLAGEEFFEVRRKRRKFTFVLGNVDLEEGYQRALEVDRMLGTTGEVLVMGDPSDTTNGARRNFIGRMSSLQGLARQSHGNMTKSYEIAEIL